MIIYSYYGSSKFILYVSITFWLVNHAKLLIYKLFYFYYYFWIWIYKSRLLFERVNELLGLIVFKHGFYFPLRN
jgi:hypothetical protein